ncbi:MAG: hypothetical protein AAF934_05400 [Bacteroidota bacterium]
MSSPMLIPEPVEGAWEASSESPTRRPEGGGERPKAFLLPFWGDAESRGHQTAQISKIRANNPPDTQQTRLTGVIRADNPKVQYKK